MNKPFHCDDCRVAALRQVIELIDERMKDGAYQKCGRRVSLAELKKMGQ